MDEPTRTGPTSQTTGERAKDAYFQALTPLRRDGQRVVGYTWPSSVSNLHQERRTGVSDVPDPMMWTSQERDVHSPSSKNPSLVANDPVPRLQVWGAGGSPQGFTQTVPSGRTLRSNATAVRTSSQPTASPPRADTQTTIAAYQAFLAEEMQRYPRSHRTIDSVARLREDLADIRREYRSLSGLFHSKLRQVLEEAKSLTDRLQKMQADSGEAGNRTTRAPGSEPRVQLNGEEDLDELRREIEKLSQACGRFLTATTSDETMHSAPDPPPRAMDV